MVPEHPAAGAELFSSADLCLYLLPAEVSPVKGVIPECLQPGPGDKDKTHKEEEQCSKRTGEDCRVLRS